MQPRIRAKLEAWTLAPIAAPAPTESPILSVTGIEKTFGGVTALKSVSMVVERGKVHALIGPNGAGKTTLVNIMSGFYRADRGAIVVRGARNATPFAASGGASGHLAHVPDDQTVRRHDRARARHGRLRAPVKAGLFDGLFRTRRHYAGGAPQDESAPMLCWISSALRLTPIAPAERSGLWTSPLVGDRPRAGRRDPRVLLLDEPAAGLVAGEIENLARLIEKLRDGGLAIVLIEHHMDLVVAVSDVVTVLDYGEVISCGPSRRCATIRASSRPISGQPKTRNFSLLAVDDLHVSYGPIDVLKGASFTVGAGEIVTILGGNGAGKTTLLRAICGLVAVAEREPSVRRRRHPPAARRIR